MSCSCIWTQAAFDSHDSVCVSSQSCRDAAGDHAFGSGIKRPPTGLLPVVAPMIWSFSFAFLLVSDYPKLAGYVCWLLFISICHHFSDRSTCVCNPPYMHHDAGGEAKRVALLKLQWCSSCMTSHHNSSEKPEVHKTPTKISTCGTTYLNAYYK